MKILPRLFMATALLFTPAFAHADTPTAASFKTDMIDNKGTVIGHAEFTQGTTGVLIEIKASGLPAGKHGMHFHETGSCQDIEHFKMSKKHIMPSGKPHGFLNPEGPHEGNLPNLIVHKDGSVHTELYTEMLSLNGKDDKPALQDADGSALIVHINQDDHMSQPIGGSGARISCGAIPPNKTAE